MKTIFYPFHAAQLTIRQARLYFSTGKTRHLHPLFGRFYEKKFREQFAEMFTQQKIQYVHAEEQFLIYLYNMGYNLLPSLAKLILTASLAEQTPAMEKTLSYALAQASEEAGIDVMGIEDVIKIEEKAKRFQRKYKASLPEKTEVDPNKKFDFNQMVMGVEAFNNRQMEDDMMLLTFKSYFELAVKKARKIREN